MKLGKVLRLGLSCHCKGTGNEEKTIRKTGSYDLCGADDYITKPFSLMVLRARIRALLRRNTGEQQSEYSSHVFRFCFDTMEFYKEGNAIELSKTANRCFTVTPFSIKSVSTY